MKNFKKLTSFFLALCISVSAFAVSAFAVEPKDALSLSGKLSASNKTLTVQFAAPDKADKVTGLQFTIEMPKGFTLEEVTTPLKNFQVDTNLNKVLLHSTDLKAIQEVATLNNGKYDILNLKVAIASTVTGGTYKATLKVEDITNGTDSITGECAASTASFTYEKAVPKTSIAKATVSGIKSKTYNGKAQTQSIAVKLGSKTLKYKTDYTVAYSSNKYPGVATVKITGVGSYTGTISKTFVIYPKKQAVSSSTKFSSSKKIKAQWTKDTTATGYQVQYSTSSKFSKATTKWITSNKTTSYTFSANVKKTYYVRVRSYKKVGKTYYYGAYSTGKKVTAKPATVKLSSSTKSTSKKTLTVKWTKVTNASGYQVTYSTKSNFKGAKTVNVSYKSSSKKLTKLTSKKKYYVKVRAYTTISGKKYYGSYSSKKTVKVK